MDQRRYGRGNGGSPLAAPRRPRTSGFRELSGPLPKDNSGKMETDSELQDSPGSDAPPGNTLAQALARQKRKRPGSASDPGDDSMDESGSGDHKEIEDKISEPVKSKEAASIQGGGPSKIPRRARSVLAKRLDPQHPARGNDLPAVHYASSPSAASVPSGRGPRRGRMPQKMRNSSKMKREIAAAAVSVSEQEREVAEALFGLANMAALQPPSPPASPARSASPVAKSEDAIAKTSAAITVAAAALIQASSPALSADGDDDSQPIISLKSSVPVSASASVSAATEEKRQKSAKREGPPEDGAPSASTSLPALEATAMVPPKRKRPRARAKAEPVPISKDGGALAVLGAAAANLAEDSLNQAKAETESILAPGLDVLAASVAATKELGKVEKPVGPPIAAFKAEKKRVAAEKKAKAEAAEKLAQKKVEPAEGAEAKAGLDVSEGNVPIIAPKLKEPRKRKEKESKGQDGEKKEKKRSKGDHDVVKRSGHIGKPAKPEAEPEFDREGSYSDKSDREPIKPASQKSAKAAKREAMAASLKAEKAASEKEPPTAPSVSRPPSAPQSAPAPVAPTPTNAPPSSSPVPASAAVLPGPGAPLPAWAQGSMPPMYFNQAMAAAAAAAAATWPNQLGMDGREGGAAAAAAQAHIPSYMLPPRRPWKRCASHVYIAHYIEYQQTLMQLSNAGLFLRMPQQPPTPLPMAFGANASAPGGGSGPSVPAPSETGPGPAPSAAVKHERGPVGEMGEGGAGQGPPGRSIGSAFQDAGARKPPQQPLGPSMQPTPKSQYSTPPPQSTSPPRAPQAPPPSSDPPPISAPPNPPPAASQGSGQAGNPPTGPGTAQVTAQAAYAAQHLAMLQQNGYPFPFNPASLNLPPFPPFSGASGHLPGISPAAVAQYMAYLQTSLGIPPQGGLPPQLLHAHHSPNEHLPQPTGGPPASAGLDVKPQTLARPNLNQQPMPGPRPPPHNDPPPNREQREEREQKVRPNLNNRPVRPPQQGEMREMDERKQFGERGGRPTEGPAMKSFLEQQSREQQARQQQQQQQQKLGGAPPYRSLDLPPAFLQSPDLLYQKQLSQLEASWKDGSYKPARPEGPTSQQQPPPPQRHPSLAGNERNGPSQSSVGPGPLGLNPAAAGMVPRGHTTMIGTPGMLPPGPNMGPMPANFAEFLADAQRRSIEQQGQRRGGPEGGRYKDQQPGGPPEGSLQSYRDLYIQQWNEQEGRMQQQVHRPPSASEGGGQRSREGTTKPLPKQQSAVGKASPSLDLEGPSPGMGGSIIPPSRAGSGAQGPSSFGPPGQRSGGAQGPAQGPPPKTVLPRGKLAQSGGPGSMQQLPLSDPTGGRGQQLGMQKGYPFASSSGPGPSFGTGGLGSSSGRPIASQSFGAMSQQQPKPMSQGPGLSLGGQSAPSGSAQMSRLVDLSAPSQQRPVGPGGGGTYLQRAGSLGPMPQGQAAPQKGGEAFARQQAKNGKGSGSANFAKPSSASGGLFNQQRLPSPGHALPPGMVAQQHMGGLAMPGGDDKSWQYRNHGNPGGGEGKLGGVKKADEETKKKADRERRAARQRQKEQVEFELQYLADQQAHDQQKKQAAAAAAVQQATEQYAAFAQAKKFAPGALLFAQQQGKAQPVGAMARQQGGKSGQPQGRGVATASGNMHAQGGLSGELGAGLTLGRNPSGSANPSNGVGNGSRNGTPGSARSHEMGPAVSHMQMARPISRGGNGARLPATVGLGQLPLPFAPKQGSAGVPGSRQSPPMPAHPGPERAAGEGNSPTGRQGRETGAAQHPQPMEPQLAKPDMSRQGYKAPADSNGLQSQSDFTMLARPPASAPASAPSPSKPLNMAQAIAQTAPARTFETHLGNLAVPVKLPVRDGPERTPLMPPHPPLRDVPERTPLMPPQPPMSGAAQVPLLVRDAVQTPNKDASLHMAPPPRIIPSQERAILPSVEGEKGLPSSGG